MQASKLFVILIGAIFTAISQLPAQQSARAIKKKPVHNNVTAADAPTVILLPDFLHTSAKRNGDTSFIYEYYDRNFLRLNLFNLNRDEDIGLIKYYKSFPVYVPASSNVSMPNEYVMQYEYAHPGMDIWIKHNTRSSEMTRYTLYKQQIVATDTVWLTDPKTQNRRRFVYQYYRTEIAGTEIEHKHEHRH